MRPFVSSMSSPSVYFPEQPRPSGVGRLINQLQYLLSSPAGSEQDDLCQVIVHAPQFLHRQELALRVEEQRSRTQIELSSAS